MVKNCIQRPSQGVPFRILSRFGMEKLEWWVYQVVKIVWEYVY